MHRFFIAANAVSGGSVTFEPEQAHQLLKVLRLRKGDLVGAFDGSGWEYDVRLTQLSPQSAQGLIQSKRLSATEPQAKITLYQSVLKGSRFEYALQKATEVGVAAIVPVISKRCVIGQVDELKSNRNQRWERILQEAAEQSGRAKVPPIAEPMLFNHVCERLRGVAVLAFEGEPARSIRSWLRDTPRPFSASLFIGPEGGFAEDEVALAQSRGAIVVSLGPRILRAETAGPVALTTMLYEWGELEPAPRPRAG